MKRCTKCILPENYPGISFSEEGICNLCIAYKPREYLGGDVLRRKIDSLLNGNENRSENHDCLLGFSGGRDSSYLLYYLVKVLGLRILCYSADNSFVPEHTKSNMRNMTDMLGVKLVIGEHDYLKRCIKHHILSWMHRPSPAMVGMLCVGCRLGMDVGMFNSAKNNRIPIVISGGTPFEGGGYKYNMVRVTPNSKKKYSFILGYLFRIMRNPKWILNYNCLVTQAREYYYHYYRPMRKRKKPPLQISPFYSYIRWKEREVISAIENELDWEKNPDIESTWRGDCDIALLKLYLYKKTLGFSDKDAGLSALIRDGQIDRGQALERLNKEGEIPEEVIKEILDNLGLNFSDLKIALEKGVRK